ncbi:DUF305 domain-containing protein [Micromonospora sp. NBC_01655]|uniref:DUF305 domain-containing protein n=1 Tax=Micromonospora sp. NBC_01655 TaxID=2975983 RepID=UPI00225707A6|nr:DUF305 domain-containing protein [Micromonospora sp. NBC_01655]MCX4471976.1 DUF305 domain-containing protein [Micromonospora sp. NBC_01655]
MRPTAAHGARRRVVALPLAALLAVAGCAAPAAAPASSSGGTGAPPAASVRPDPADVPFLTAMVAHHDRTRVIAAAAAGRVTDAELRTLVAAVDATEADELATMRRWLAAATPSGDADGHASHHAHPGGSPTADPDLDRLRSAPADRFDAVLVAVLTAHQRRAAALARAHRPAAVGAEVRDLADRIERSRTAQIQLMSRLPAARSD